MAQRIYQTFKKHNDRKRKAQKKMQETGDTDSLVSSDLDDIPEPPKNLIVPPPLP